MIANVDRNFFAKSFENVIGHRLLFRQDIFGNYGGVREGYYDGSKAGNISVMICVVVITK